MVLATLAAGVSLGLRDTNLGCGEQFSSTTFNVVMVAIVFVFALSFLGVWEIPIPGFVGSGAAAEVASHEGAVGAFVKGALTTVLATPCSGPALGPVFGYTLNQPPQVTFLIFGCIGLGMSSPYLLIGAFPNLIRFLPKPGAWMDTFKHMMGFVMLATIVFLFGIIKKDYLVPTFAMMVGLWAGCWWIGHVAVRRRARKAWVQGVGRRPGHVGGIHVARTAPVDHSLAKLLAHRTGQADQRRQHGADRLYGRLVFDLQGEFVPGHRDQGSPRRISAYKVVPMRPT
jgi:thiol:disulfide interchange protein